MFKRGGGESASRTKNEEGVERSPLVERGPHGGLRLTPPRKQRGHPRHPIDHIVDTTRQCHVSVAQPVRRTRAPANSVGDMPWLDG